jgi:hypothetical protein
MISFFISRLTFLNLFFRSRYSLGLEIVALRQQLGVLKRKHTRPRLRIRDRIFWILLRRYWPAWSNALLSSNRKRLSPGIGLREEVSRLMRILSAGTDHCLTLRRILEPVSMPRGILDFSWLQHPGDFSI